MKVEELMIGDWVKHLGRQWRVIDIATTSHYPITLGEDYFEKCDHNGTRLLNKQQIEQVDPIPISGEILEQNGWKHFSKDNQKLDFHNTEHWLLYKCEAWRLNDNTILYFRIQYDHHTQYVGKIQYVHELQHALRLCGIEKDIAL